MTQAWMVRAGRRPMKSLQPICNVCFIEKLPVPRPPLAVQQRIMAQVEKLKALLKRSETSLEIEVTLHEAANIRSREREAA